ncbi:MAG: MAPEG family protein [Rhizobiaceae bacterium]
MAIELTLLVWATVFGLAQILIWAVLSDWQRGLSYGAGPRDEPRPLTGVAARCERAVRNYFETFIFFAAAVLAASAADRLGPMSELGAHLYFWARLVYLPLYLAGVFLVRSLVWFVAFAGIGLVLAGIAWP